MPLKRLPHSPEAREKMRAAALGRRHTDITRLKIGLARLGKPHTPETKAKISAARKKPAETVEQVCARKRRERRAVDFARVKQKKLDIRRAYQLGRMDLVQDIIKSHGRWSYRTLHHPEVSDGQLGGKIIWGYPKSLDERVRIGLIKGYIRHTKDRAKRYG